MKFTIHDIKRFTERLTATARFTGRKTKSALPILQGVRITATEDGIVELCATDLDTWGICDLPASNVEPGQIVVPAKVLADAIKQTGRQTWVSLEAKDGELTIGGGATTMRLRTLNAADYPKEPEFGGDPYTLPFPAEGFKRVTIAASTDDARPVLTGIHLEEDEDELILVATDSYRLAVVRTGILIDGFTKWWDGFKTDGAKPTMLLPAKKLAAEVPRFTGANPTLLVDQRWVAVAGDAGLIITRQIDGAFPNWKQLMPDLHACPYVMVADHDEWQRTIDQANTVAEDHVPLRFTTDEQGEVTVTVTRQDVGGLTILMAGSRSTMPDPIQFNSKYLGDGVKFIGAGEVRLQLVTPLKPGVFFDRDASAYLLMPVRI